MQPLRRHDCDLLHFCIGYEEEEEEDKAHAPHLQHRKGMLPWTADDLPTNRENRSRILLGRFKPLRLYSTAVVTAKEKLT